MKNSIQSYRNAKKKINILTVIESMWFAPRSITDCSCSAVIELTSPDATPLLSFSRPPLFFDGEEDDAFEERSATLPPLVRISEF